MGRTQEINAPLVKCSTIGPSSSIVRTYSNYGVGLGAGAESGIGSGIGAGIGSGTGVGAGLEVSRSGCRGEGIHFIHFIPAGAAGGAEVGASENALAALLREAAAVAVR